MWLEFSFSVVTFACLLFLPGFLAFRCLGASRVTSLLSAPAFSIAMFCVLGIAYDAFDIRSSAAFVAVIPICALAGMATARHFLIRWHNDPAIDNLMDTYNWKHATLYVTVGLLTGLAIYIKSLDGANSFVPSYDNLYHYNAIRALADSGIWTSFDVSCYLALPDSANPMPGGTYPSGGYYPMGWHVLVVLLMDILGCDEMLAVNVVNYLFVSVVFPLGMYQLLSTLFSRKSVIVAGSLCSCAFAIFPWHLLIEWPLFPNLAAFCLLPALMSCFIVFSKATASRLTREVSVLDSREKAHGAAFFAYCIACGLIHPNGIFTAALLLSPFLATTVGCAVASHRGAAAGIAASIVVCASIATLWLALYHIPAFSRAVDVLITSRQTPEEARLGLFFFSFTNEIGQPLLSLLTLIGSFFLLARRQNRWLLASLLLAMLVYYVSACAEEGLFKQVMTGFWYTESKRTGCIVGLAAIPIATCGIAGIYEGLVCLLKMQMKEDSFRKIRKPLALTLGCIFASVLLVIPIAQGKSGESTALGDMMLQAQSNYTSTVYSREEVEFVDSVISTIGDEEVVINLPYDGSIIAYGVNGLKTYYLERYGYEPPFESEESEIIRTRLIDVAHDPVVAAAVERVGAKYVLLLERDDDETVYGFEDDQWTGISSITDATPGFTVVMESETMRLYQINADS